MSLWHETLRLDGERLDPDITKAVTAATLVRTMDGAESLELAVADPDMTLLTSGALTRKGKAPTRQQQLRQAAWDRFGAVRLVLDGVYFRLAGVNGQYDEPPWQITLTFESEIATLMRRKNRPVKWSRGRGTRLGFIAHLAYLSEPHALMDRGILSFAVYAPRLDKRDPIQQPKDPERTKGISPSAHLTIGGARITGEQRRQLETSLKVADDLGATERVFLAMIVAGIGESGFQVIMNRRGSDYGGVFQGLVRSGSNGAARFKITDTKGMARSFLLGGKGFQAGGAIKLAASDPDLSPGAIAYKVEGSRANFSSDAAAEGHYQQHIAEARAILDAWGGAAQTITVRESYEFSAGQRDQATGKRENYWDASGRLAVDERDWRRFATRNGLWIGPDTWFLKNRPAFVIDGKPRRGQSRKARLTDQGVLGVGFDADVGIATSEIRVRALAPRWTAGPGTVWQWDAMGPLTGRWLIQENRLDLTLPNEIAEITLRRPAPALPEPAPSTHTRTEDAPEAGTARERIVKVAKKALAKQPHYRYAQIRPMPRSLFAFPQLAIPTGGTTDGILRIDCSAFATLVYKAAGVPDPNGPAYNYNGAGYTGTLVAQGTRTQSPQPGDLVFYGSGPPYDHVGVYIGGGQVIEMGGTPGPKNLPVHYRSDFAGYWTYDLGDA